MIHAQFASTWFKYSRWVLTGLILIGLIWGVDVASAAPIEEPMPPVARQSSKMNASMDVTTVLSEDFASGELPTGWITSDYKGWVFDNPGERDNETGGSGNFAIADGDFFDGLITTLDTPVLDLSNYSSVTLKFNTYYLTGFDGWVSVLVSTDNGNTWTHVWSEGWFYQGAVTVDITAQAAWQSNVMIRFDYFDMKYYHYYWQVDDVRVEADIPLLNAPSNLTLIQASSADITLAWTDNSDNESGFKIERSLDGINDWGQVGTVPPAVTTYTDTGLSCETSYHYRVRACIVNVDSEHTNIVSGDTTACPTAPSDLAVTLTSQTAITLI
ncbi:MAG: fibronectin type III domain-containing protein [Chloroflexi bacterium]|nr:fibronectin type III domain-containing protein [Chloroflexota bacterium]